MEDSLPVTDQVFSPTGLEGATCQVVVSNRLVDWSISDSCVSTKLDVHSGSAGDVKEPVVKHEVNDHFRETASRRLVFGLV